VTTTFNHVTPTAQNTNKEQQNTHRIMSYSAASEILPQITVSQMKLKVRTITPKWLTFSPSGGLCAHYKCKYCTVYFNDLILK